MFHVCDSCDDTCSPPLQLTSMDSEGGILIKEYMKMMTDMIVLCATLALSLFFWVISLTISTYYGQLLCLPVLKCLAKLVLFSLN